MSIHRPAARIAFSLIVALASVSIVAEEETVAKPMMIPEAKLPEGFPAPGAVGEVITKTYPAHRLARVRAARGNNDGAFMKLFRHIERNDIKMTAPVEMVMDDEGKTGKPVASESMAFMYGNAGIGDAGPDPADPSVVVEDVPEMTVVSLGVRGSYREDRFAGFVETLREWLASHPEWVAAGPPRTLAYNSPFVPGILKYAEVQIPIVPTPKPARP